MPQIPYIATNFSGAFTPINGNGQISVTWAQLVWAAITAGKAAGDEYAYGIYSTLERLHRGSMIRAYLRQESSGLLVRTMPYIASDPSEKTSISFYLGITLAKLFAEVLFGVPRMLHFAVYGQNYQITAGLGASRPDLIGLAPNGDWFVFEAKGRSNGFDAGALNTAKAQAEQIDTIDNVAPICRIASESFFANGLRFRMDDPDDRGANPRSLMVTRDEFEHAYFDPIRAIVESRGQGMQLVISNRRYRGARIEEVDCWIAIPEQDVMPTNTLLPELQFSDEYLGKDGVLIRLGSSWSEANMLLEPNLRSI